MGEARSSRAGGLRLWAYGFGLRVCFKTFLGRLKWLRVADQGLQTLRHSTNTNTPNPKPLTPNLRNPEPQDPRAHKSKALNQLPESPPTARTEAAAPSEATAALGRMEDSGCLGFRD